MRIIRQSNAPDEVITPAHIEQCWLGPLTLNVWKPSKGSSLRLEVTVKVLVLRAHVPLLLTYCGNLNAEHSPIRSYP